MLPTVQRYLRARYDLEVPVLVLEETELPRVSPRLSGDGLRNWLQKVCASCLRQGARFGLENPSVVTQR